jgi:hypothetical protein
MDQVEMNLLVQSSCYQVRPDLPDIVVGVLSPMAAFPFPKAGPRRKISEYAVRIGEWVFRQRLLDAVPFLGPGQHPHFV